MCCVMESASYNLKRLTLELGGNDAAIVMSDVNIDEVAPLIFWGAFANSSQYCFPITLVDNPPEDSRIVREEPFDPILPLLKFNDIDDVVRRANDSEYGLGESIWSKDETLALSIANRLQTGTVWINEIHTIAPNKPMAGHKQSGIGVENGMYGLLEYTVPKIINLNRKSS